MEDLSINRLKSRSEIELLRQQIGAEKFDKYQATVYEELRALKPGDRFNVVERIRPSNQAVFLKLACLYILETGNACNIEIGNNWDMIKGIQTFNDYQTELAFIRTRRHSVSATYYEKAQ